VLCAHINSILFCKKRRKKEEKKGAVWARSEEKEKY
jgi:hypothetical protein